MRENKGGKTHIHIQQLIVERMLCYTVHYRVFYIFKNQQPALITIQQNTCHLLHVA
jgi:hypothetical protein